VGSATMIGSAGVPQRQASSWLIQSLVAAGRSLVFCELMVAEAGLLGGPVLALVLLYRTIGRQDRPPQLLPPAMLLVILLVPCCLLGVRWLAGLTRRLAESWCGVPIASPYRHPPAGPEPGSPGLVRQRIKQALTDPATWRDLLWAVVNVGAGWILVAVSPGLVLFFLLALVAPYTPTQVLVLSVPVAVLGLRTGPPLLRAYGALARSLLGPTRNAELQLQVRRLAKTRSDALDAGAAEIRRIERDLHDGAQARLVAMGMTLDAAEQLVDVNPVAAKALLADARDASAKALSELRSLVRGVHPPVLADRGLADAIRALAMDGPVRVRVAAELLGRPPPPVESAAYFAVSELLANVSKHAAAGQVWIDIRHSVGVLRLGVTDNGAGGADPARGTGLRGIERRIAAFDGVLAVSSPPGGPTVVNMEIPCTLSSPKISSC
jgi:signal transduction histidine kinase